jgi:trimeric autotransporter adhesin
VTLGQPAPITGAIIALRSSIFQVQVPPLNLTIPSGQTTVTFTLATSAVTSVQVAIITATSGSFSQSASLTVTPVGAAQLSALTIYPSQVSGGSSTTGTVTLSAPAPLNGVSVSLRSGSILAAQAPFSVNVPAGRTSATFNITTSHVTFSTAVTITATANGSSQIATLTVQ